MDGDIKGMARRRLMAWLGAAAAAGALGGCGGGAGNSTGPTEPVDETARLQRRINEQAAAARQDGLVGVVLGRLGGPDARLMRAAAGNTRLAGGRALGGDERFIIGSNTKAMTAALAALCVERGLLRWDSKPAELLSELRGRLHAGYQDLTLALLLDHLGGVPAFTGEPELLRFAGFLESYGGALPGSETGRRRFFANWLLSQAPAARVGQEPLYSNAGYALAAAMLEAASGQDFKTLFDGLLARPLQLDVQWGAPLGDAQPQGHVGNTAQQLQAWQPLPGDLQAWIEVLGPAGAANLSTSGYGEWQRWHLQALQGRATPLPAAYLARIKSLKTGQYALGWQGSEADGRPLIVHSGADAGFMSIVGLALDGKVALFAMTNTFGIRADGGSWVMESLNRSLLALLA